MRMINVSTACIYTNLEAAARSIKWSKADIYRTNERGGLVGLIGKKKTISHKYLELVRPAYGVELDSPYTLPIGYRGFFSAHP